jgi:secretion/DNA translocation related TadE-like protein
VRAWYRTGPAPATDASRRGRRGDEQGIATVWGAALVAVLSVVTFVAAGATGLVGARHRAESAADLAALAGAVAARDGADACAAAAEVAGANDGELLTCAESDRAVEVTVGVLTPVLWGATWQQVGAARAGPGDAPQDSPVPTGGRASAGPGASDGSAYSRGADSKWAAVLSGAEPWGPAPVAGGPEPAGPASVGRVPPGPVEPLELAAPVAPPR